MARAADKPGRCPSVPLGALCVVAPQSIPSRVRGPVLTALARSVGDEASLDLVRGRVSEALTAAGGSLVVAAGALGVSRRWLSDYLRDHPIAEAPRRPSGRPPGRCTARVASRRVCALAGPCASRLCLPSARCLWPHAIRRTVAGVPYTPPCRSCGHLACGEECSCDCLA